MKNETIHKLFICLVIFIALATPALAEEADVEITINSIVEFTVNTVAALTFTYDQYSDFGVPQDLGDINYDLISNVAWKVVGKILDGPGGGQTPNDWDGTNWTLKANGVTLNESTNKTIDSGSGPIIRDNAVWEVLLTIPWPKSVGTADCRIAMTASTL